MGSAPDSETLWVSPGGDWVGETIPPELENTVIHVPAANILHLAHRIVNADLGQS